MDELLTLNCNLPDIDDKPSIMGAFFIERANDNRVMRAVVRGLTGNTGALTFRLCITS